MEQLWMYAPSKPVEQIPPLTLAYMGDTLYDLFIRQYLIAKSNLKVDHLHRQATRYVSAKGQASSLHVIMDALDEDEKEIVRKGRNAKSGSIPKNSDMIEYRYSTAFECLLGYLYYKQEFERLAYIMQLTVKEEGS